MGDPTSGAKPAPTPEDVRAATELINEARTGCRRLIDSLSRVRDDLLAASALTTNDDEHDPEGATIAFERERLSEQLRQARADLDDLDQAADRVADGAYWVCERCEGPIAVGRLMARPTTRLCITCASVPSR